MTRYSNKLNKLKLIYGSLCVYCNNSEANTVDHIIPVKRKGSNELENLLPVCKKCNVRKGASSIYSYCSSAIIIPIDIKRSAAGYCKILDYQNEDMLPVNRTLSIRSSRHSPDTVKKLGKLEYNQQNRKLIALYIAGDIYLEYNAKRIVSLIYHGQYNEALAKITSYTAINHDLAISAHCNNMSDFKSRITFLQTFFRNKPLILANISLISYLLT